jgi:hypothetical protein
MAYSRVSEHSSMLFDATRNEAYARAIRGLVKPESVVLDLGAGMGLHGLLAAASGASRVYLAEPQPVVHAAREAARANHLTERVVILQNRIEDVRLEERADLIISVFTGNLLYSEDLLPSLFHARDKYLKPNGRLLPDRAQLWLAPLCAPALHAKFISRWSAPVMGLDYSAGRRYLANEILWPSRASLAESCQLGPGAPLVDLELMTATSGDCRATGTCGIETSGLCHGLLGWIQIRLLDQWLSSHPSAPEVHWSPAILPLDPPLQLEKGEQISVAIDRPYQGDWTWTVSAATGVRRHSTFLSGSHGISELRALAPQSRPGLNEEGSEVLCVLDMMRRSLSNQAIAESIAQSGDKDPIGALRRVQAIAMRYGRRG